MGDTPEEHAVDYRFILANERTFLAWVRTALGLIAGGVALDQFVTVTARPGVVGPLSVAVILLGALAAITGTVRWSRADTVIRGGLPMARSRGVIVVGVAIAVLAVVIALVVR